MSKFNDLNKKVGADSEKATQQASDGFSKLGGIVSKLGPALLAIFAVDKILDFGKKVVEVTSQFQKLSAVLTNTLGSQSAAQRALKDIQQFAATTNFSVLQVTEGFVKLANRGFVPTANELRKLADIANSTGKELDQLIEAVLDATTGEFERLKEFGVRAAKEGDRVTFTFKGVKTQVDNTEESIRKYILGLGDLNGVAGSTEAISKTLGGQISNLGDAFDTLLNKIGDTSKGLIGGLVRLANDGLVLITDLISSDAELRFKELNERLEAAGNAAGSVFGLTAEEAAKARKEAIATEFKNIKEQVFDFQQELIRERIKLNQIIEDGNEGSAPGQKQKLLVESLESEILLRRQFIARREADEREDAQKAAQATKESGAKKVKAQKDLEQEILDTLAEAKAGRDKLAGNDEQAELVLLDRRFEKQKEALQKEAELGKVSQADANALLLAQEEKYLTDRAEIRQKFAEKEAKELGKRLDEQAKEDEKRAKDEQERLQDEIKQRDKLIEQATKESQALVESTIKVTDSLADQQFMTATAFLEATKTIFAGNAELQAVFFGIQQALALAELIFSTQRSLAQIEAGKAAAQLQYEAAYASIPFFGPGIAAGFQAKTEALAQTQKALVISQAAASGATIAAQTLAGFVGGFAEGGETPGQTTLATVGEKGKEWVAPNWMYQDGRMAPIFDALEGIRQRGYIGSTTANTVGFDDSRIVGELQRSNKRPVHQLNFDKRGFTQYIINSNSRARRAAARYHTS
jgi:hypothetical protein